MGAPSERVKYSPESSLIVIILNGIFAIYERPLGTLVYDLLIKNQLVDMRNYTRIFRMGPWTGKPKRVF